MCLTIPAKIIKINKNKARVKQGKILGQVDISLLSNPRVGDYILERAGLAIRKLPRKEAREILKLLNK